jgi:hypothetical protein
VPDLGRLPPVAPGDKWLRQWENVATAARLGPSGVGYLGGMTLLLWILAVVLVVSGILALFRRQILWGVVLIIVGLLVGPGGVSIFTN